MDYFTALLQPYKELLMGIDKILAVQVYQIKVRKPMENLIYTIPIKISQSFSPI